MTASGDTAMGRLPAPVLRGARISTWIIAIAIPVLSLLPESLMPPIGQGLAEHFLAYCVLALAAALGYGRAFGYLSLFAAALALAGLFEFAQVLLPERQFSAMDFAAGVVGAALGVSLAHLIRRRIGKPPVAKSRKAARTAEK